MSMKQDISNLARQMGAKSGSSFNLLEQHVTHPDGRVSQPSSLRSSFEGGKPASIRGSFEGGLRSSFGGGKQLSMRSHRGSMDGKPTAFEEGTQTLHYHILPYLVFIFSTSLLYTSNDFL